MAQKVILLHGLFMNASLLAPLRKRLQAAGFDCRALSYSSVLRTPDENAARLIPTIRAFAEGESVYFVGHSLGGLLLRHLQEQAPELFQNSKVITLGTPHCGNKFAAKMRPIFGFLINHAWQRGLDGKAPTWKKEIPLLSVAGTRPIGLGRLFRIFTPEEVNDGTVLQKETEFPEAFEYRTIHTSHVAMLYKKETARLIADWFKNSPRDQHQPQLSL